MSRIAVLDFETTGLSPDEGDRATEVAIVLVENGVVRDRYQSLMNAGVRIPAFITELTGITDAMVRAAPPAKVVMAQAAAFVGSTPLVAHNASFDQRFWTSELRRAGMPAPHPFACTLLTSRRLYPAAPNHRLDTLASYHGLRRTGTAHRALADAELAAALLHRILDDLRSQYRVSAPDHGLLMRMQTVSRARLPAFLAREARAEA